MLGTSTSVSLDDKMYMTDLTVAGAEQNSLTVQMFGCLAKTLPLKRATPTSWKYDGSIELAVGDNDSDGLTLVAQSDDIGDIGHIHLTRIEMEDFTTCALSDAESEFVRQLATEDEEPTVTLSFKICIVPPVENMVGDELDQSTAQAVNVDVVVEDSGRKMHMTDLTVDYSREGTIQPTLSSLTIQVFGCVAENCDILHLKRATPIKWKYDGTIELALADPDSDGLTLVAQSDDIGDIGHIHLTKGEMEDFTATALPNAKLEYVRQMATEDEGLTVTLSFNMCIFPLDEHPVADDPHHSTDALMKDSDSEISIPALIIDFLREGAEQPALNSLTIHVFGCVANDFAALHLERTSRTSWEYDGRIERLVADPEFDGLRLVFYSEDIGELGRIHVKIGKMDGFTTSALSNAKLDFVGNLQASGEDASILMLSFKMHITPLDENMVGYNDDESTSLANAVAYSNAAVEDPGLLFPFAAQLPDNDPSKSFFLSTCGVFFLHRFRVARDEEDLDNSITAFEQASQCPLSAAAEGLDYLREAGNAFKARYDLKRNLSDLNRAIEIYEGLVGSTDSNANIHPWLNSPTTSLTRRFERTPPQLIDRSTTIPIQQNALRTTSKEDETLSTLLTDLADLLQDRFRRTRDVNDITKEISLRQKALRLTPESDPGMPAYLNNLGSAYVDRFNVAGNMTDIYDSIPMYQKSRHLMPEGHPNKPALLDHLANAYGALYEHTGDLNDISEALSAHQNAVDLTPEGAPDMHERLHWMGTSFRLRFEKTEDLNDISQAIAAHRRAVSLVPKGDKQHHVVLEGLGMSLVSSFQQTRDLSELSEAVSTARQAVLLTPEGDKNMYTVLNLLASALLTRFQQTKDLDDSSDAISVYEKLIGLIPEGHPHMPAVLLNQGRSLLDHIVHTRDITEVGTAVSKMRLAATSSTGSPSLRLSAARFWATFSQSVDPAEALNAWTTIIQLLSQVVGMEQTIQKRHQNLVEFSELPTSAAAAAFSLGHPDMVLEWLEQGRCLIWNQLNNLRTPLDDLHAHDPALADHFSKVSSALENAGSRAESSSIRGEGSTMAQLQEDANAHIKLAQQRDRLLENIRGIPGFSNFLRPPQCSNLLSDLPEEGPVVVINVHKDRCDALALIAGADTPLHIPLSNFYTQVEKHQRGMYRYLSAHGVRSRGSQPEFDEESSVRAGGLVVFGPRNVLGDILRELWLLVVKPILDALAISTENPSADPQRIWWCPTGPLAFLPIHAAGLYDDKLNQLGTCLTDFVISSYTSTVSALVERVKKVRTLNENAHAHDGLLLISVSETPRFPRLASIPGTKREIELIQQRLEDNLRILPLSQDSATINNVMEGMESYSCIHLACHAGQDPGNPLESGFYLHDGRLELSDVIKKQVAISDFAFLSACQTSTGHATLSEEAVHLAAGMLAAGYRGVVGTMWAIQDYYGPQIAEEFYGNLINHVGHDGRKRLSSDGAAHALHYAIQKVRKTVGDSEQSLLVWVPYVHFGL